MKTILVIDDEQPMLTTLEVILRSAGYEVVTAASGEAGLRQAYECLPDLVLCDIHLPDLDGTTVLQALREDPATADKQVVLMTGIDKEDFALRKAINMGADDFLHKPFTPKELTDCVATRIRRNDLNRHVATRTYDHLRHTLHSTLPHEFFAPIANILGVTEVVRQNETLSRQETLQLVNTIEQHARKLHRSIDNYLKLIDLASMNRTVKFAELSATKVWNTIATTAQSTASQKDRSADLRIEGLPYALPLSENDLATLVEELVDNACIYSRKGTPIIVGLSHDSNFFRLQVSDQGRGLSETQVRELREASHPTKTNSVAEAPVKGIGLLLVQKLVEARGGGLQIQSQPGQGSHFTLFWPLGKK
jgi:DNA-binding response OmpR family regulator/anti-sigma regulatory factor (Ser/Thr protein kinase)